MFDDSSIFVLYRWWFFDNAVVLFNSRIFVWEFSCYINALTIYVKFLFLLVLFLFFSLFPLIFFILWECILCVCVSTCLQGCSCPYICIHFLRGFFFFLPLNNLWYLGEEKTWKYVYTDMNTKTGTVTIRTHSHKINKRRKKKKNRNNAFRNKNLSLTINALMWPGNSQTKVLELKRMINFVENCKFGS